MIKLGQKVRDNITGFERIVTGRTEYLYGCIRYMIQSKIREDGSYAEAIWIDEPQLTVIDEKSLNDESVNGYGYRENPLKNSVPKK